MKLPHHQIKMFCSSAGSQINIVVLKKIYIAAMPSQCNILMFDYKKKANASSALLNSKTACYFLTVVNHHRTKLKTCNLKQRPIQHHSSMSRAISYGITSRKRKLRSTWRSGNLWSKSNKIFSYRPSIPRGKLSKIQYQNMSHDQNQDASTPPNNPAKLSQNRSPQQSAQRGAKIV
jgi:hypothetical protein